MDSFPAALGKDAPRLGRRAVLLSGAAMLAACAAPSQTDDGLPPLVPLENFKLGHVIVVADNVQQGPFSRDATPDQLEAALEPKIRSVFSRYQGDHLYHIAVAVGAYALAQPGIPIVAAPKSALGLEVNVWDNNTRSKINEEPKQIIVLERLSGSSILGSGLVMTAEEQLEELSKQAVQEIYNWIVENKDWFTDEAAAERARAAAAQEG